MEKLIGKKILSAKINPDKDFVILETDQGKLYLQWFGDCCAHCYLAHVSGADALVGGTVAKAYSAEWSVIKNVEDDYGEIETMGTNITTDKGYVTFESRVEHNGYYAGYLELMDEVEFKEHSKWNRPRNLGMKDLEDF